MGLKVIIINPNSCGINPHEIEWNGHDYGALNREIYKLGKFGSFVQLHIEEQHAIYLDANGEMKPKQLQRWSWLGYTWGPLLGIGVVMRHRGNRTVDATLDIEYLAARIRWGV